MQTKERDVREEVAQRYFQMIDERRINLIAQRRSLSSIPMSQQSKVKMSS